MSTILTSTSSSARTTSSIVVAPPAACTLRRRASWSTTGRSTQSGAISSDARESCDASASTISITSAPSRVFSSSDVPRAITSPWSMTTMWSARWSASSRYCVVSSSVGALADAPAQELPELEPRARVEAGGRLVEEQHARLADQAGAEVEPAAHAAGVAADETVGRVAEAEPLQRVGRTAARLGPAETVQQPDDLEVLAARELVVDGRELAGQPDQLTHLLGVADDVVPVHERGAGVGLQQRREDADERRLAGTVRAEEALDRPLGNVQVDVGERTRLAERLSDAGISTMATARDSTVPPG